MFDINKPDLKDCLQIQYIIDQKTKPPGSLGRLEELAMQMALIIGKTNNQNSIFKEIIIKKPTMLVFAGDHGIAEEGISIAPSEVTQQMVLNFLNGGAAINCICRSNDMTIDVIDAGILLPIDDERLIVKSLGQGTANFTKQPAMSVEQVNAGLKHGVVIAQSKIEQGSNVLGFGEMGIGNTSSAAAIMSALLKIPVTDCVGRGTGIDDSSLLKKIELIEKSLQLHQDKLDSPINILASVGGFEIVEMVGAMLTTAKAQCLILVDGFIATAAAMLAIRINSNVLDYMVFCHQSNEQGHRLMLESLNVQPLLSLGLRLGEGTGAALGLPILRSAASFFNDMASFESAGVEAV
ncbi:MAG: nicotinate-nucleotide--dimethylbenzimidazole phosphoribosyltransferase [Gammaproteobacteria bacterium]|nr:nicotinate-nucleotide--dimethylbenzimidazole phosphoribosyltransferase [Gammaproteobacteria bacterium]